ncbi:MAG: restriction endonuclease subunit S [Oceanospirillaceae bacterium]|nr:restriction endonuclease subunit S [Oceanospirillaceae bacterium]
MSTVPKLRFKEFNDSWSIHKLKEITTYVDYRGKTPEKSEQGVFLVTAKNIKNGFIDYNCSSEYISPNIYDEAMRRGKPELGDVLLTTEAPLGNVAQIDRTDIALAQRVIKFRGRSNLSNDFLKQNMLSDGFQRLLLSKAIGSTVLGIQGKVLHSLPLTVPSREEQQKIADFLTAVDTRIEQLTRKEALLKQYKKGVMQKIFSQEIRFKADDGSEFPEWEDKKLGEVVKIASGKSKSSFIQATGKNIIVDMGGISSTPKLIAKKSTDYDGDYLTTNDLVMPKDDIGGGLIIGKVVAIPENNKYICGDHIYKLTVLSGEIGYLQYAINSYSINKSFRQKANGTAQIGLNRREVESQQVPFPCIEEQQKVYKFLRAIEQKLDHINLQIDTAKQFKKGLLQQMFV